MHPNVNYSRRNKSSVGKKSSKHDAHGKALRSDRVMPSACLNNTSSSAPVEADQICPNVAPPSSHQNAPIHVSSLQPEAKPSRCPRNEALSRRKLAITQLRRFGTSFASNNSVHESGANTSGEHTDAIESKTSAERHSNHFDSHEGSVRENRIDMLPVKKKWMKRISENYDHSKGVAKQSNIPDIHQAKGGEKQLRRSNRIKKPTATRCGSLACTLRKRDEFGRVVKASTPAQTKSSARIERITWQIQNEFKKRSKAVKRWNPSQHMSIYQQMIFNAETASSHPLEADPTWHRNVLEKINLEVIRHLMSPGVEKIAEAKAQDFIAYLNKELNVHVYIPGFDYEEMRKRCCQALIKEMHNFVKTRMADVARNLKIWSGANVNQQVAYYMMGLLNTCAEMLKRQHLEGIERLINENRAETDGKPGPSSAGMR